ncbi:MAG: hypothetical protein A2V88_00850 [Elusimicrobia bacterium RBG_16_66_12]|nr:MAG: hypothetical protein A2V88_00850 [Elusimicrobia bacterium RBG_16_66_12]
MNADRTSDTILDIFPSGVAAIFSHDLRIDRGAGLRPYLESFCFRTSGPPGTVRSVAVAFRPRGATPAGATVALQVTSLFENADQITLFQSASIRIATQIPEARGGIPFPMDAGGPWVLWCGSASIAAAAQATFQISYRPFAQGC